MGVLVLSDILLSPCWGSVYTRYCQYQCAGRGLTHYYSQLSQTPDIIGPHGLMSRSAPLIGQDTPGRALIGRAWC